MCSIIGSDTIIFAVGNGTKVQSNALVQVAFNVAVRATSPAINFLNIVAPPGPGTVPAIEIWFVLNIVIVVAALIVVISVHLSGAKYCVLLNQLKCPQVQRRSQQCHQLQQCPCKRSRHQPMVCNTSFAFQMHGSSSRRTDRSGASHNANNAGNEQIKPKWISNALNGMGVLRFSKDSKTYLDINPVAYLNDKTAYSIFVIARLTNVATSGVQYLVSDDLNGLRVFFNGSRWYEMLHKY
jgi:hypothetical protein